jgi:hypothetical protein
MFLTDQEVYAKPITEKEMVADRQGVLVVNTKSNESLYILRWADEVYSVYNHPHTERIAVECIKHRWLSCEDYPVRIYSSLEEAIETIATTTRGE